MNTHLVFGVLVMLFLAGCPADEAPSASSDGGLAADVGPADMAGAPALPICEAPPTSGPIAGLCLELWTAMRVRGEGECANTEFELGPRPPPPDMGVEKGGEPVPDADVNPDPDAMALVPAPVDAGPPRNDGTVPGDSGTDGGTDQGRPPSDASIGPLDADGLPSVDAAPSPNDAGPSLMDAGADAALVQPPSSCLNADVRACECRARLTGEILRVSDGPPPVGCPLATIWAEAGGDVTHVQLALADDVVAILAMRADGLGLKARLDALGTRAALSVLFERDRDGNGRIRLESEGQLVGIVQAGGSLSELQLSPTERLELSPPLCSDQSEQCAARGHSLLFQDGNAPYPIASGVQDELAGWRFAGYRLATKPGEGACGPDQIHFGVTRAP